jgi:hypothetical protein
MFRHDGNGVGMMMLDLIEGQFAFQCVSAAHVVRVYIADNHIRFELKDLLQVFYGFPIELKRCKVIQITNVLAGENVVATAQAEGVF